MTKRAAQQVLALATEDPLRVFSLDDFRRLGSFTEVEARKLTTTVSNLYHSNKLARYPAPADHPREPGQRPPKWLYGLSQPKSAPPASVIPAFPWKPLRRCPATWALTNPPRQPKEN